MPHNRLSRKKRKREIPATWERPAWKRNSQDIPYGFCHCGCGQKTNPCTETNKRRGFVKGEPHRFLPGHQFRRSKTDYIEEDRGYSTPCWIWQRCINKSEGYGIVQHPRTKKLCYAHRLYYERFVGSIPEAAQIDHLCHARTCVRPDHLEAVTPAVNSRRSRHVKLTEAMVAEIRALWETKEMTPQALALRFQVSKHTIRGIIDYKSWRDVPATTS